MAHKRGALCELGRGESISNGSNGIIILAHSMESREKSAINLHLSLLQESSKHFKIRRDPCGGGGEGQVYEGSFYGFRDLIMKIEMIAP